MADEDEDSTLLCGSKGLITLDEQHHYVRAKQQVDASDAECGRYNILLDEVRQQLWQCRERLQVLSGRREQAAAQARHAAHTGRHASLGYLRDRLAGLEANVAQQQHRRHWLTHRLVTLEKYAAAAAFDDGKLVSTKFFVNEMEKDFERRKQAQKSCYIQREEKLAKIYELEYTREVLRVQQQLPARAPGEATAEHSAISSGTQKLQAHLEQRRATRAAAEQCRVDTAARQRDNTRRIVARLVQEERRRLAREDMHTLSSPDSSGSSTPPRGPTSDAHGRARASRLSSGDLERLQHLLETSAKGGGGDDEGDDLGDEGSLGGSLGSVGRQWMKRRPDMPVERPQVTSDPCPFSWKPDVIEFKDFQVGWTYYRRVSIVNLSRTRSSCRYIGLFEHNYYQLEQPLAESLRVHFQPPGFLGTGLAAKLELEFTPRMLGDGECLVRFQAPNGEFQVPVRFVAQRAEPRLDRRAVEFGDLVLGTRVKRSVVLRNTGKPAVTTSTEQQPTSAKTATDIVSSILDQLFDRLPIIDFDGGLGVCGSGEGELPAGGRARLHLGCVADLEGAWRQQFVVEFDDPNCEPFTLTASYSGHEFPISVRNPHLSLDICLCGLTYWDTFEIVNTGKVASRVRTVVPDDMKPFVDIQGSPALVQADNSFKVKIFFKPKRSLLSPPHRFFDPATHILDFPVSFHVDAGSLGASLGGARGAPIVGSVQAAVSSNHVWLKPERVEFGRVTLLESACRRVQLTNGGLTVQQCHFTGLPDSVTVQPGNGGAVLLPGETVPLDVIFSPSVSGQHQFSLVVETLDGGRATVTCHGLATTPPLSLSATSIKLSGVPVQGEKKAAVYVQCPKVPLAEEKFFAMGGSFEFQPPDGIPVAIHPMVGFVPYKQC
ncbi:Cilia- and flagella-associated protein 74 [Amphibalanus amphitrite]|uniref:Cilia-and flagella-associated protein 74 n=1 Tax=Amphibalanus amphitrite TaxID=1232801 RepID=A0A6A4VP38_AMPAM|nr:Cilia- and flagella-associated protein 74 [Amphibalanus amphitrite]